MVCPRWVAASNLWWEIISLYEFAACGCLLLERWTIFDLFWPLGWPQKDQNSWFVLYKWQYKTCDQKSYLRANFQLLDIIFRGMENFWSFCSPLTRRVPPKWVKKYGFTKVNATIKWEWWILTFLLTPFFILGD